MFVTERCVLSVLLFIDWRQLFKEMSDLLNVGSVGQYDAVYFKPIPTTQCLNI